MLARVVGRHCETGDIVVRTRGCPPTSRPATCSRSPATGAYCRAMASNYNHRGAPAGGRGPRRGERTVLLRRETLEDLLALDPGRAA